MKKIKLLEGENVKFSGRAHWTAYVLHYLAIIALAAIALLLSILIAKKSGDEQPWGLWVAIVWLFAILSAVWPLVNISLRKKDKFIVTDKRVILNAGNSRKRYFEEPVEEGAAKVKVEQSFIGKVFGFAKVTAPDEDGEMVFKNVGGAKALRTALAAFIPAPAVEAPAQAAAEPAVPAENE